MAASPTVKKIREDMYLVSWREPTTHQATNTIQFKLQTDDDDANLWSLKYQGNGTATVTIELKSISGQQNPTVVFATLDGVCQEMTEVDADSCDTWKTTFSNVCLRYWINPSNYSALPMRFEVVIDFKPLKTTYIKEGEQNILNHLQQLLEDQKFTDITFQVKSETIKAHLIIVAAGSPVLATMFQQDFLEKQTKTVEIKDTKPEVFKQLLQYLYTGKATLIEKEGMAHDLLAVADMYGVDSLKEECAVILIKNLQVENAARTLVTAHLQSSPKLHQATLSFMSKHGKAICSRSDWMDVIKSYPELCFQATQLMMMGC